ncbi:MAG: DNA primase [Candidatus Electrothrix sp. YB6]
MTGNTAWSETKERVRETADIVQVIGEHVQLKKAGSGYTGLCPFHGEKTSSFSVNPQGQFFHCFGCHESGDVFAFMMKYHHMTFPEALKELARRYQIDLPERNLTDADRERMRQREQLYQVNREAARMYHAFLLDSDTARGARQYLQDRGVPQEVIRQYQLGYAPAPESNGWQFILSRLQQRRFPVEALEQAGLAVQKKQGGYYDRFRDRILFPIYDMSGREVAFGGRILGEGKPKYLNSPETPIFSKSRLLFGLYQHRQAIRSARRAVVVEGNFDLLLLAVHGIDNVVAPLGTALTREHIRSLRSYCDEVVLLFDGDSAGLRATRRSIPFFLSEQLAAKVALLPEGHDPDSLVREQGAAGIRELLDAAGPLEEFVFSALVQEHGLTLSGKNQIITELTELMREAADPAQRELMAAHFSEQLGVSPARFLAEQGQNRQEPMPIPPPPDIMPDELQDIPPEFFVSGPKTEMPPETFFFAGLSKQQRQLLNFLILYPEFLSELLAGGLRNVIEGSSVLDLIDAMEQLAKEGPLMPEQLLNMVSPSGAKQYIADLLVRGGGESMATDDQGRGQCDAFLLWLQNTAQQKKAAELQKRINLAEKNKDYKLVDNLQKEAFALRYKRLQGQET